MRIKLWKFHKCKYRKWKFWTLYLFYFHVRESPTPQHSDWYVMSSAGAGAWGRGGADNLSDNPNLEGGTTMNGISKSVLEFHESPMGYVWFLTHNLNMYSYQCELVIHNLNLYAIRWDRLLVVNGIMAHGQERGAMRPRLGGADAPVLAMAHVWSLAPGAMKHWPWIVG